MRRPSLRLCSGALLVCCSSTSVHPLLERHSRQPLDQTKDKEPQRPEGPGGSQQLSHPQGLAELAEQPAGFEEDLLQERLGSVPLSTLEAFVERLRVDRAIPATSPDGSPALRALSAARRAAALEVAEAQRPALLRAAVGLKQRDRSGGTALGAAATSTAEAAEDAFGGDMAPGRSGVAVAMKVHEDSPLDKEIGMVQGVTVIAFLLFFVGIVQMLMYPDPQVRSYSYKMVFTCIAIFEALSFVTIQNDVILGGLVDPYVGGRRSALRRFISFLVFLGWLVGMSWACWRVRHYPAKLFAASGILSHLCAFTLVESYASAQTEAAQALYEHKGMEAVYVLYALSPVATTLAFAGLRLASRRLRKAVAPAPPPVASLRGDASRLGSKGPSLDGHPVRLPRKSLVTHWMRRAGVLRSGEAEAYRKWLQETDEAENQTSASVTGFLICRLCYCVAAGRVPPMDCEKDMLHGCNASTQTVWLMCSCTLLVYLTIVAVSHFRHQVKCDIVHRKATLKHGLPRQLSEAPEPSQDAESAPASAVTVAQESLESAEGQLEVLVNLQLSLLMAMSWCFLVIVRWMLNEGIPGGATGHRVLNAFVMSPLCLAVIIIMDKLADTHRVSSETAEAFMKTFALCVGLEWEKAVAASMSAAIDVSTVGNLHPSLCQLTVCVVLSAALLPVWMWFIVPRAQLPVPPREPIDTD